MKFVMLMLVALVLGVAFIAAPAYPIISVTAIAVLAIGLGIVLRRDMRTLAELKAQSRLCPQCGRDMGGDFSEPCPECGWDAFEVEDAEADDTISEIEHP